MRLREAINRQPRVVLIAWCLSLILLLAVVDYLTGSAYSLSALYLLPVAAAAWYTGRTSGVSLSLLSGAAWALAEALCTHRHGPMLFLNALVRVGSFVAVSYFLSYLRAARDRQTELIHFIVHDLRSPLTNVIAGLELFGDNEEINTDPDQRELYDMARISVQRLMTLTDSLLDVPRLEAGRMPLHPARLSARELVDASISQVALWARLGEVSIEADLDAGAEYVQADRAVTVRVLVNLLSNAIKFSPPGSTITIRTRLRKSGRLGFYVCDQGPGVPKEWATRVFDKFGQVGARRAGAATGTGLGLTFCRLAVEAQGGRIWIEPEQDRGTMVVFTLPLAAPAGSVDAPAREVSLHR